jgi:hypothetical protein
MKVDHSHVQWRALVLVVFNLYVLVVAYHPDSVLDGVMDVGFPLYPRVAGSHWSKQYNFKGDKSPQHAFFQRENKARGLML